MDAIDTFEYTVTDIVETEALNIRRLWKFQIRDDPSQETPLTRTTTVEVFLSHEISASYESNMDTDGGYEVELEQVPRDVRERLAERLSRDVTVLRGEVTEHELTGGTDAT